MRALEEQGRLAGASGAANAASDQERQAVLDNMTALMRQLSQANDRLASLRQQALNPAATTRPSNG